MEKESSVRFFAESTFYEQLAVKTTPIVRHGGRTDQLARGPPG
jgi:hypothetical protein